MVAKPRGVHHGSAHLQQQEMVKIEMSYWIVQLITHSKNARDIFLVGVNNIRVADRADLKLLVSHVQHLGDGHGRLGVTFGRNIVEEEFKVANDDELSEPAFLNAARFRYFDVTFVGRPDTSGRIDAQWPFSCKESTGKLSSVCLSIPKTQYSLWSVGSGQRGGTLSLQATWQAKPHTSQTTPWRLKPTIRDVQWLHLSGDGKERTRNWCDLERSDNVLVSGEEWRGSEPTLLDGDGWDKLRVCCNCICICIMCWLCWLDMSTIPDPCIRPLRSITRWPKGDPPIPLPPSVWLCCPGVWPCCGLRSEADLLLLLSTDGARLSSMSPSSLSADAARLSDDSLRNCSRNDICEMGLSKTEGDKRVNNYIKQLSGWQGKKKKINGLLCGWNGQARQRSSVKWQ